MPWYTIALIVCLAIGPFDALYMYIKAQKRRDALKRRREAQREQAEGAADAPSEDGNTDA